MTAPTPGPDAVARDEVGEVREALARLIAEHTEEIVRYAPNGHPDHNRWSWLGDGHSEAFKDQFREIADAVLASGLVVPVGEVERWHEAALMSAAGESAAETERDRAVAQVAAVRRELERWDGYGHGEFNLHMPEHLPCGACNMMAAIRAEMTAALDTAPASPTTDQRIEARHLGPEHIDRQVELPDGTRGTLHAHTTFHAHAVVRVDEFTLANRYLDPSDVVTLIGGEE